VAERAGSWIGLLARRPRRKTRRPGTQDLGKIRRGGNADDLGHICTSFALLQFVGARNRAVTAAYLIQVGDDDYFPLTALVN
jgi:hypothetical protein